MTRPVKQLSALTAVLLLLSCLLGACSKSPEKLTEIDGVLRSKDGKIAVVKAPDSYYAIRLGDMQAIITADGTDGVLLYSVIGDPDGNYLADQNLSVYRKEGTNLPTLTELDAVQITLYEYTDSRIGHTPLAALKDPEKVADLVRLATGDKTIPASEIRQDYTLRLELLFLADPNAGIGIMLEYRKFPSDIDGYGTNFIYDTDALCYIPVGDTLERYFIDEEETE